MTGDLFLPPPLYLGGGFDPHDSLDDVIARSKFGIGGIFEAWCFDRHGNLKWHQKPKNSIPNIALNNILDVYYGAVAKISTWYGGIIDNASFTALSATDTSASHTGWVENTNYSESVRQTWVPGTSASQAIANTSSNYLTFTMNPGSTINLKGFFLISVSTKGGTTGILGATAPLTTPQPANSGDVVKVLYTVSATPN